jgi:hypothetical protein
VFFLIVLFVSSLLLSCDNETEEVKIYYDNGNINKLYYINKDKEKQGDYIIYNKEGVIIAKANYTQGKMNGKFWEYYENGIIKKKGYVKDDTVLYSYSYDKQGYFVDIYRKVLCKNNSNNIKTGEKLIIETFLTGKTEKQDSIEAYILIDYPFGMERHISYNVDKMGFGNFDINLNYPGKYKITMINIVLGEIGNHQHGGSFDFFLKPNSNYKMNESCSIMLDGQKKQAYKCIINEYKDTVLYYFLEDDLYVPQ